MNDFENLLKKVANNERFAICLFGKYNSGIQARHLLHKYNFKYSEVKLNLIPREPYDFDSFQDFEVDVALPVSQINSTINFKDILRIFKSRVLKLFYYGCKTIIKRLKKPVNVCVQNEFEASEPDYIICGGRMATLGINEKIELICAHTMDYDVFLGTSVKISQEYIVFIDSYEPFHPDYLQLGEKNLTPEEYYPFIEESFKILEKKFEVPVIVTAHPRSDPEITKKWLPNRKIASGNSLELIAKAFLVCGHASTAFNFAVLLHKPVVLFNLLSLPNNTRKGVALLANHLGTNYYWIDKKNLEFNDGLLKLNHTRYSEYKTNFIKEKGTPEKLIFEIVADAFLGKSCA